MGNHALNIIFLNSVSYKLLKEMSVLIILNALKVPIIHTKKWASDTLRWTLLVILCKVEFHFPIDEEKQDPKECLIG